MRVVEFANTKAAMSPPVAVVAVVVLAAAPLAVNVNGACVQRKSSLRLGRTQFIRK